MSSPSLSSPKARLPHYTHTWPLEVLRLAARQAVVAALSLPPGSTAHTAAIQRALDLEYGLALRGGVQ